MKMKKTMYYKRRERFGNKLNNSWNLCLGRDDVWLYRVFHNAWGTWTVQKESCGDLFWMFDTKNEAMDAAEFKSGLYSGEFFDTVKRPRAVNK